MGMRFRRFDKGSAGIVRASMMFLNILRSAVGG
jgi:hypothetical protein